ncbi:MAG: regulatory iron-sulfur-containing complex subunit RicT [Anaerolineales bacterium]|jgi:cell fate regulator YaaT (PSP1 superfamily)
MSKKIIGIRFQKIGKLYHFDASGYGSVQPGDYVVVNTSRGQQLGEVVGLFDDPPEPPKGTWKKIERKATPNDLLIKQNWEKKELDVMIQCRETVIEKQLVGLKIVKAEFSFDGKVLSILYSTEDDSEITLSPLIKGVKKSFPDVKVEFRRIGPRDVAKLIGGMGACGLEVRCCSTFMTEFCPISIKMAKAQGVSLDPSEITGMCGRLRCCLIYEYELYVEARKELPKRGTRVVTPSGEGKVIDAMPLRNIIVVRLDDEDKSRAEFYNDEIEPWDEVEALRRKAKEPYEKHNGGDVDNSKSVKGKKKG